MELLIYNKIHYLDTLTEKEVTALIANGGTTKDKYDARHKKGDIVEVRPDGYWTGLHARGFDKEAFSVLSVPGVNHAENKHLMNPYIEREENADRHIVERIVRRRKYQVPGVGFNETTKIETLNSAAFAIVLKDKSVG